MEINVVALFFILSATILTQKEQRGLHNAELIILVTEEKVLYSTIDTHHCFKSKHFIIIYLLY